MYIYLRIINTHFNKLLFVTFFNEFDYSLDSIILHFI